MWLKGLISELLGEISEPIIHCDSQSALVLSKNPLYHDKTKHVDLVNKNEVILKKVATDVNPADMLQNPFQV